MVSIWKRGKYSEGENLSHASYSGIIVGACKSDCVREIAGWHSLVCPRNKSSSNSSKKVSSRGNNTTLTSSFSIRLPTIPPRNRFLWSLPWQEALCLSVGHLSRPHKMQLQLWFRIFGGQQQDERLYLIHQLLMRLLIWLLIVWTPMR